MSDLQTYDGRVAIVTGAGQGLGREYALLLAARGAQVLVNDPASGRADEVVAEIAAAGGIAAANRESVATPEGGRAIVAAAVEHFGRLDIVVNNAGIVRDHAFHNLSEQDITDVLDVHLGGAFWVTRPAWPLLREQGYGRVVFTTSLSGLIGNFGQANYGAAKTGVLGLARVLAAEGARHGIRSNVIAPLASTNMATQLTAFDVTSFEARDVAAVVAYLCHESCAVTGEVFSAIGGRVARYFVGLTQGIYRPELSPEDVAAHVAEICDTTGFSEPRTLAAEIESVLALVSPAPEGA